MTIIEQIKAEIGRRIQENESWKDFHRSKGETTNFDDVKIVELQSILSFLSTLESEKPEVDLDEETIRIEFHTIADKCFNEGIEGWQREKLIARHFAQWGAEHLASVGKTSPNTVEEAAESFAFKSLDEVVLYGCTLSGRRACFIAGAKWQNEQMMKEAIPCKVFWHDGPLLDYTQEQQDNALERIGANVGDKVKVIIVKED